MKPTTFEKGLIIGERENAKEIEGDRFRDTGFYQCPPNTPETVLTLDNEGPDSARFPK